MEQLPNSNEYEPHLRPELRLDLSGGDALPFNLVTAAMKQIEGDELARLNQSVWLATQIGSGATYDDLLRIVDLHVDLVDTSGTFPLYATGSKIIGAVEQLNAHIGLMPAGINSEIEGLYPELDTPDIGVAEYLRLLDDEITRVGATIGWDYEHMDALYTYKGALVRCAALLQRYGVTAPPPQPD